MRMKDKTEQQESDALIVTVESLEAELSRLKTENKSRMNEVRNLAEEEIADKDSQISGLEDENSELKEQLELLDKLSLEYQIARGTKKILRQVRKDLVQVSKDIEGEIKREVKGAVKSAKKMGSEFRKRTGL
jgi:predicted nuclease with TOPRIM domain